MRIVRFMLLFILCGNMSGAVASAAAVRLPNARPVRALHFVLRGVTVNDAKRMADMAKASGFNTLIVALGDAVRLRTYPGNPLPGAWSAEELVAFAKYARQQGLAVIPEVKLLTHQEKFFGKSRPELLFNAGTYDPQKTEVYGLVFAYLDEVIALLHPTAVHIGHDEVKGIFKGTFRKPINSDERMLPADLYLEDINRIHAYLNKKGVETWMWGDMLSSPDEFPGLRSNEFRQSVPGYGRELRKKLPRSVVICDWRYGDDQQDFPTMGILKSEGFRVLGATFSKLVTTRNFSRYAAMHGADGMIATTWFHVQRKEWDVLERIIRDSGEAFQKDFPNAK